MLKRDCIYFLYAEGLKLIFTLILFIVSGIISHFLITLIICLILQHSDFLVDRMFEIGNLFQLQTSSKIGQAMHIQKHFSEKLK